MTGRDLVLAGMPLVWGLLGWGAAWLTKPGPIRWINRIGGALALAVGLALCGLVLLSPQLA